MSIKPPKLAERIHCQISGSYDKTGLLGDLEEEFALIVSSQGLKRAKYWYWTHLLKCFLPYALFNFLWRIIMLLNYLKIAGRMIRREKGGAFLNIMGLALGLASFLMIFIFNQYELSYDGFHEKKDRIFRVIQKFHGHHHAGKDQFAVTPYPAAKMITQEYPEAESYCRIDRTADVRILVGDKEFWETRAGFADANFFQFFSFPLIEGTPKKALSDPASVVISQSVDHRYFPNGGGLGRRIQLGGQDLLVTGIMEDMPFNSHFRLDVIMPMEKQIQDNGRDINSWREGSVYSYIAISADAQASILEKKLTSLVNTHMPGHGQHSTELLLQPLNRIHLYSDADLEFGPNGDIRTVRLLGAIAILILLIACINYVNLSTARMSKRIKEVGVRKMSGALQYQLIWQFLSESGLFTAISASVALVITALFLVPFSQFMSRELSLAMMLTPSFILCFLGLYGLVSLLAGAYPAFYVSRFGSMAILARKIQVAGKKINLRRILVVMQFTGSIILIISTLVVRNQMRYIQQMDVGYTRDHLLIVKTQSNGIRDRLDVIKHELGALPHVLDVSSASYLPNLVKDQTVFNWPGKSDDVEISTYAGYIDENYVNIFDLEIVAGRNFSMDHEDKNGAFLLNEQAVHVLGWENLIGKELTHWNGKTRPVVGVIRNFNFHSVYREIDPLFFYFEPKFRNNKLIVKLEGHHIQEAVESVENYWRKMAPDTPFEFSFFDEIFNATYKKELKLQQTYFFFAIMAIFIACMGLLGLASYTADLRRKEIGIRKVLGASLFKIIIHLNADLFLMIVISNLIAWPVSWFFMSHWLNQFAFKTYPHMTLFIGTGLLTFLIALFTVILQSYRAAAANPAETLRYE